MHLIWMYRFLFFAILLFALRKGEEPERLVAALMIAAGVLDVINHLMFGDPTFFAVNPGHIVIDSWSLLAMLWIALRANRAWPMWVCAAQIIVVLSHVAKLTELSLVRYGYFAMAQLPLPIQTTALLLGTIAHSRRSERIGRYHAWRLT
ncbi:MAG: hypothetical protein B7Y36_08890 [Novosphingobium sp. 28-62-57]|nr:MAG: hypothetical protein B7Z36_01970 [Novosphingobium sp. 12-63-9]OYZ10919.1 MAG: hypothetical protein B7Y36_08890 [Novosphingobium sp. 28-62-57]OZA35756.1 MAG: hypothetical protein B7X92_09190 [Novosphingobium sp. 17-62-9]